MDDHTSYRGAWGVYPFLPSGNILVSDMQYGLYVLGNKGLNILNHKNSTPTLSPNPANNKIEIEMPKNEMTLDLLVCDVQGKIVGQKQISIGNNSFSVAHLNAGIYILKAQGEKTSYQQKFIVK